MEVGSASEGPERLCGVRAHCKDGCDRQTERREQNSHEVSESHSFLTHQEGGKNRDSPPQTLKNTGFLEPMLGGFWCCEF